MALTAKPISTISYNTEGHLKRTIENLFNTGRIEDYRYIFHYGEEGDKNHYHIFIVPNRRIDTVELRSIFNEQDPNSDKPLGCLPFRQSKYDHWIMYVIHDVDYLYAHNSDNDGDGKIIYNIEDIKTPFPEQLKRDYKKAISLKNTENQKILNAIEKGKTLTSIAYEENINPTKIIALNNLYSIDSHASLINEAMKTRMHELEKDLTQSNKNVSTLAEENMKLRGIEITKQNESWYDK